jgi:hypothetical protein
VHSPLEDHEEHPLEAPGFFDGEQGVRSSNDFFLLDGFIGPFFDKHIRQSKHDARNLANNPNESNAREPVFKQNHQKNA